MPRCLPFRCSPSALLSISIAMSGCGSAKSVDLFSASSGGGVGANGGTEGSSAPIGNGSSQTGGSSASLGASAGTGGNAVKGGQSPAAGEPNLGDAGSTPAMEGGAPPSGGSDAGRGGSPSAGANAVAGKGGAEPNGASGKGGTACSAHATEICDGTDNDCNGSIDEGACPTACNGFVIDGKGYMACKTDTVQTKAAEQCAAQGMRLVWIESQQQDAALLAALLKLDASLGVPQNSFYIGASDSPQEGRWHWIDGAEFWAGGAQGMPLGNAYAHWAVGRPNGGASENCSVILVNAPDKGLPGEWNDSPCSELHGALCQTP